MVDCANKRSPRWFSRRLEINKLMLAQA